MSYKLVGVLSVLALCLPVVAQVDTAIIAGTIKDSSGALITAAKVHFVRDATGVEASTVTGAVGEYVSPPLRPGAYTVRAEATGFRPEVSKFNLELNQRAVIDFTMEVGAVSETVNVEAAATLLESESSTITSLQNEQAINNLPLNARNFNQLIGLSTGVMPAQTQTASLAITALRGTTANVTNGIGFRSNNYRVDGVDNTEVHNSQGVMLDAPVEAIQEFRLETSVPSAEFGRSGATINVVYKSGGRDLHGDLFEYLRNADLDAKNFFNAPGIPIAPFHMNEFGATVGGPVVLPHYNRQRNKTFFFFSWEAERQVQGITSLSTVPIPAFKQGNFSAYAHPIYDPLTGTAANNNQRTPFPGNIIPAARFDKPGSALLNLFPDPNLPGQVNNYASNPNQTVDRDNYDIKVDQNFSAHDQAFFRYSQHKTQQYVPGPLPLPAIGSGSANNDLYPLKQVVAAYTRTLTPTLVDEFRAAFTRLNIQSLQLNYGNNLADQIGIPGVNQGSNVLYSGLTSITLAGYPNLGDGGNHPSFIPLNTFQFNDIVSWIKGRHTFRYGGEYVRYQKNFFQSASAIHGSYSFGPIYTTNLASPSGTGLSLADMLLGAPANGNIGYPFGLVGFRRTNYALFMQDTWKVTSALTLSLGLRYDYFACFPFCEVDNRMTYFRPDLGGPFSVGTPQIPWRSGMKPDTKNFGPRVGVAYKIGSRTVVRSGFGLMYSPDANPSLGNGNPPYAGSVNFANDQGNFPGARTLDMGFVVPPGTQFSPLGASLIGQDPNMRIPYASQWNLSLQRELSGRLLLTAAYVGTSGKELLMDGNLNQPAPGPGAVAPRRPFPLYGDVTWNNSPNSSIYNSLQLSGEKRLARGVQFTASYTWSHGIDYGTFVGAPQNFQNLAAERGNFDTDVRQHFVLSGFWQLPFGRDRAFGRTMPRALDLLAGGWQLNTITSLYTGLPFTATSSVNTLNISATQRPNVIGVGNLPSDQRTINHWFNTAAFATPALYQFGNAGRDILRGPGTREVDLAFAKSFVLTEKQRRSLEFRAEMFNISNTPQFNNPNASIGSPSAGIISVAGSAATFQRTSRQVQMALKLYF